jgi:hypothetical protein
MHKLLFSILLLIGLVSCTEQPYKTDGHMDVKLPDRFDDEKELVSDSSITDSLSN